MRDIGFNVNNMVIVKIIIMFVGSLGFIVIVEGVEIEV